MSARAGKKIGIKGHENFHPAALTKARARS
jgi:hypothetical protein